MKFTCILAIFAILVSFTLAFPQEKEMVEYKGWQFSGNGGGGRNSGYDLNIDVRKNIWNSNNGRHSIDLTGGHSQHWGGQEGKTAADRRFGASYIYRFKG